jgi:hypothetical protein
MGGNQKSIGRDCFLIGQNAFLRNATAIERGAKSAYQPSVMISLVPRCANLSSTTDPDSG